MTYEYNNYLAHHGVKGQKWGVRRYQNEDGTPKLNFWQRLTHDRKEQIRKDAVAENSEKVKYHQQDKVFWQKKEAELKNKREHFIKEFGSEKDWKATVKDARHQQRLSQDRISAWKRREKRLMNMNVDNLSIHQVKKATKLKWYEYWMPND